MLEYDPHYPTILPVGIAVPLVLALNILIPILAIFVARRMTRLRWLPHAFAFLWVLFSAFTLATLALPAMAPGEELGPGNGFLLLPVLGETPIVLIVYALTLFFPRLHGSATQQDRSATIR